MKMNISKVKNLNWKLKLCICIIATIIGLICVKLSFNNWEYKENNYDYSQVYSINGVITNAYFKKYLDPTTNVSKSSAYIDVKLESGKTITIGLGGNLSYSKGENIVVYTDGTHYSTTKKGVAMDAQYAIINLLIASIISISIIAIWSVLFGWKGFLISLFILFILFIRLENN